MGKLKYDKYNSNPVLSKDITEDIIGKKYGKYYCAPVYASQYNKLIIGKVSSGAADCAVVPDIKQAVKRGESLVVVSPSTGILEDCKKFIGDDYLVECIDLRPSKINDTAGFNPLDCLYVSDTSNAELLSRTATDLLSRTAHQLSSLFITGSIENFNSNFDDIMAINTFSIVMLYLAGISKQHITLFDVHAYVCKVLREGSKSFFHDFSTLSQDNDFLRESYRLYDNLFEISANGAINAADYIVLTSFTHLYERLETINNFWNRNIFADGIDMNRFLRGKSLIYILTSETLSDIKENISFLIKGMLLRQSYVFNPSLKIIPVRFIIDDCRDIVRPHEFHQMSTWCRQTKFTILHKTVLNFPQDSTERNLYIYNFPIKEFLGSQDDETTDFISYIFDIPRDKISNLKSDKLYYKYGDRKPIKFKKIREY